MEVKLKPGVQRLKGKVNREAVEIYPELEDLVVEPSLEEQILKPEKYGYSEVTVKGVTAEIDEDIKPENIKEGVEILGVEGGYKGIDTSDATATADDILEGKTAYVNKQKLEGAIGKYDGSYSGNISAGVWENTNRNTLPIPFYGGVATAVGTDIYFIFGGYYPGYNYKYDTITNTFTKMKNLSLKGSYGSGGG